MCDPAPLLGCSEHSVHYGVLGWSVCDPASLLGCSEHSVHYGVLGWSMCDPAPLHAHHSFPVLDVQGHTRDFLKMVLPASWLVALRNRYIVFIE